MCTSAGADAGAEAEDFDHQCGLVAAIVVGAVAGAPLQLALFAFPGFVQSYWRAAGFTGAIDADLVIGTAIAGAGVLPLQAALLALPAFEQS